MSAELTFVTIAPGLFNPNGDAENARVLARRSEWAGLAARVVTVESTAQLPQRVDAVVIGSCSDSDRPAGLELLLGLADALHGWVGSEVPVLAIGTGWELLCAEIEQAGSILHGLGLLNGRAVQRAERVSGELVITSDYGTMAGYENHGCDILMAEGAPLGRVRSGVGNGAGTADEGVIAGSLYGTHLHGPVLAKNPVFADSLLTRIALRAGLDYHPSDRTAVADGYAADARSAILDGLGLTG